MRIPHRVIGGILVTTLLTQLTACGSIFFPDRRGQIDGKIDPVIVALDAVGLLFYVIPGLIAFGVDFATGAIYLEPGKTAQVAPEKLQQAIGADGTVDKRKLQAILEQELGPLPTGRSTPDPAQGQRATTGPVRTATGRLNAPHKETP